MAAVQQGEYDDVIGHVTVFDCRYPYEFEGGHIAVSFTFTIRYKIKIQFFFASRLWFSVWFRLIHILI